MGIDIHGSSACRFSSAKSATLPLNLTEHLEGLSSLKRSSPQQTYQQQRNGKPKVRSDHLYQLFAYLKSLESRTGPDRHALGVLLYAQADRALNLRFRLPEHELWVRTIDLSRSWQEIGSQLFKVVEDADGSMHLPSEETPGRPVH